MAGMSSSYKAEEQFPLGTRVRPNEVGMKTIKVLKNRSGCVVGYSRDGEACRVLWDGCRSPDTWGRQLLLKDLR